MAEKTVYVLAAAGSLLLTGQLIGWLGALWREVLRPGRRLQDRYGLGSWVVITGGAGGIGFSFAKAFADLKFNLILIDKDPGVLKSASELHKRYQVDTLPIVTDLTQTPISEIAEKICDFDISILINNAGIHHFESFLTTPHAKIESILSLNVVALTRLTHILLPKLVSRPHKSALINMSSIAGLVPTPLAAVYSASKAYIRAFSLALAAECDLDVVAVEPATVRSGMTAWLPESYFVLDSDLLVQRTLRKLGYQKETMGAKRHMALYELTKWRDLEIQVSRRYLEMQTLARTKNSLYLHVF